MSKKKKQHIWKKWAGRLHLWLGLLTGIIVFIVAVTGCIFVFHDEIQDLTRDWRKVTPRDAKFVAPSVLKNNVLELFPGADASMVVYQTRERPAHVFAIIEESPHHIYFNPYTAELAHVQDLENDFFLIIEDLHMHLLLPEAIGKQIVGASTLIFILMLITGIILWWPKKKKSFKTNLKIKWNARWRRVNYDWHRTTGFYVSFLALFLALTGLSFSYEWMNEGFYILGNLGKEHPEDEIRLEIDSTTIESTGNALDISMIKTFEMMPNSGMYFVWDQGPDAPVVTGAYPDALEYDHQSNFYFHPATGELLKQHFYADKSNGMKLQEMSYGLHTGQYFGLPGKIIAFFGSLFVAGLPVSGFMLWWGRRNKKKTRVEDVSR
ncbi:PepSY domain-containing protein [Antarcticibacterium flavum]|uniref:PepSY domain-containing protein n=1 Tax=Antarcticibacterium flavum TaxID=2058175 RepID=A0A5B7X6K7_9FLAO|nr:MULTISPECIES: PepSY-associated TM helix domain-containing protein [Antarcticibacterium]MCM4159269.1 peptidase [Antarcticibacterium sp. W02-3]QCY71019.1 PepSY domain-containing protein [Antarcticibacterium flavum]